MQLDHSLLLEGSPKMINRVLTVATGVMLFALPLTANAQGGAAAGATTGAVGGAIVGGPVGSVGISVCGRP